MGRITSVAAPSTGSIGYGYSYTPTGQLYQVTRAITATTTYAYDGAGRLTGLETTNAAERALRPAVIWRKQCCGTQSDLGNRFVERILSVVTTCRQQGRNVWAFLTESVAAAWAGHPAPSLLPTT